MTTFAQFIAEMAAARTQDLAKTYYHGTTKTATGEKILKEGIKPPELEAHEKWAGRRKTDAFVPQSGRVYITTDIAMAQIFAIGGDMAGSENHHWVKDAIKEDGRYGWIFEIQGSQLRDVLPDEDEIAGWLSIWVHADKMKLGEVERRLLHNAESVSTEHQWSKFKHTGYMDVGTVIAKKLISTLTLEDVFYLIDKGKNVAHLGKLEPAHAWKIDKKKLGALKRDGSNFFKEAEQVR